MGLLNGLISYWKLDGNSNDIVNGNNGTDTNISYVSGKISLCALGASGKINTNAPLTRYQFIRSTGVFTINFWFKSSSTSYNEGLFATAGTVFSGWFVLKRSQNIEVVIFNSAAQTACIYNSTGGNFFTDNNWHMITVVGDGTKLKVYKDAVQFGSDYNYIKSFPSTAADPFTAYIGGFPDISGTFQMTGNMDESGIWNIALTQADVTKLYNNANGLSYPFTNPGNFLSFF